MYKFPTRRIFIDDTLNESFAQNGFVIIPFLEKEVLAQLLEEVSSLKIQGLKKRFYTTVHSADPIYRANINRIVSSFTDGYLDTFLYHRKPEQTL
jgi:hypothetical protein